jgi:hypothetical protein
MSDSPYRVAPPRPPDPYLLAWRDLKRRRASMHAAAGGALALWAISLMAPYVGVRLAWLVAILTTVTLFLRIVTFVCPRCGWRFTQKGWTERPFTTVCLHCALPVDERQRQADAIDVDPEALSAQRHVRVEVEAPDATSPPEDVGRAEPDESGAQASRRAR